MLTKKQYQLILMDLNLPNESGIDLTASLKSDEQFTNVAIIAVTASAIREDIRSIEGLFDAYITKPVNFIELIRTLELHLNIKL